MKYDFLVLGADGMQGLIVTRFLLEEGYSIFAADLYNSKIINLLKKYNRNKSHFSYIDLRNIEATTKIIKKSGTDVVINCADMYWNLNVFKACLSAQTNCVDLGSWIELTRAQINTNKLFKKIGKTAITGCGSVPGIGNIMLKYASAQFDLIESVDVGFAWNSNIKKFVIPFSMKSILEEFTYKPRYLKDREWVEVNPLEISFERTFRLVGKQKSFMIQHPELYTFYHYFKDKGLKNIRFFGGFPTHSLEKIYSLIDLGFHSDKPIKIKELNVKIAPLELLNPVLKKLNSPPGYTESENLWVDIMGYRNNQKHSVRMECIVPPIRGWESAGCNIDTGFPASIIAQMIKDGRINTPGSFAPEGIVPEEEFFKEITAKGMAIYQDGILIAGEENYIHNAHRRRKLRQTEVLLEV